MDAPLLLSLLGPLDGHHATDLVDVEGTALAVLPGGVAPPGLSISFDESADRLQRLDGMFFEPDGAFFWRCPGDGRVWLVEGELYDGGPALHHVLLRLRWELPPPWTADGRQGIAPVRADGTSSRSPFRLLFPCFGIERGEGTVELPAIGGYARLDAFLAWFQAVYGTEPTADGDVKRPT